VRRLFAVVVTMLLALLVAHPATAQAAAVAPRISSTFFGMHDPLQDASVRYGAVRLWDVGTSWADLEPAKDTYGFGNLDARVARARARGARVTLVLGSTPAWAATDPTAESAKWLPVGSSSPPRDPADWISYVTTVARRYQGRIDSYQIWNEASLPQFWRGTPAGLAQLTTAARIAIKRADPRALVVSTPMLPRQRNWSTWSTTYLKALRARGWPVDVFAIHSYQRDKLTGPEGRAAGIRKMRRVLTSVKAPALPIWDTEANYASNQYAMYKVIGTQAAEWVARAYLDSLRYQVSRTYWYAFNAPVGHLGVTMAPDNSAARAFTRVSSWLVGRTWKGCTTAPVTKAVVKKVRVNGRLVSRKVRVKTGVTVTTCQLERGTKTSWVTWATPAPQASPVPAITVNGTAPVPATARARLPVKAKVVCGLLTACRPTTKKTVVTTVPVLLR
jgi:hypothetical protein